MDIEKKKIGRPTIYTPELAKEICETIACTSKGLTKLCKEYDHWPNPDTVYTWMNKHKDFSERYRLSKRQQIDVIVDEILTIADDSSNDTCLSENGKLVTNSENINRARLRVNARQWLASKLAPRLYGDKAQEHIALKFPDDLSKSDGMLSISNEVFRALTHEEITPAQAKSITSSLKDFAHNLLVIDLAKEIEEMKNRTTKIHKDNEHK